MITRYIIGIDIGTTNIKGSLYSSKGRLVSSSNVSYGSFFLENNYHEQNPDDWVKGIIKVLKELILSKDVKSRLSAISLSTQGGTVIPVDKNYKPLTKAITWLDRRASGLLSEDKKLNAQNIRFYEIRRLADQAHLRRVQKIAGFGSGDSDGQREY